MAADSRDALDLWQETHTQLLRFLQAARRRCYPEATRDDLRDIAAEKAWQILVSGILLEKNTAERTAFLQRVARNGLIDHARERRTRRAYEGAAMLERVADLRSAAALPADAATQGEEFGRAIGQCLRALGARTCRVWELRLLHQQTSADIAADPRVAMTAPAVDALLHRTRVHLRTFLRNRDLIHLSPGSAASLWAELAKQLPPGADTPPPSRHTGP